ncbi:MAG: hypothetical protein KBD25_06420 [Rickettsiaceae bacterium]|nr:hypothetical protein [Rickettsiaceae bacterium]
METTVIFSLKPKFADLIETREKTHEFRSYVPKNIPKYIWFYITTPICRLTYIAEVSEITEYPNKIPHNGYGNKDFNNGLKKSKFAYHILNLHKLKEPITLTALRPIYGFVAPQGFTYANKYPALIKYLEDTTKLVKIF